MGGDVAVESTPGKGAKFTVSLRLRPAQPERASSPRVKLRPTDAPAQSAMRLLVADDHPVNLEVVLRQLEILGLSAEVAADGAAALATWRKAPCAVVLLDLHMPVLDGFGLARAIRQEEAKGGLSRTGLIAVTADAVKGRSARCFAAGIDSFVTKPVSIDALACALAPWIPNLVPKAAVADLTGALFDPGTLRALFDGQDARLAGLVKNFADCASRDLAAMRAASDARQLANSAHRLKGAARMAGARLIAEQASQIESAAKVGDLASARLKVESLEPLLAKTIRTMQSVV
jgi:CheY-like chemotaxis protein